MSVSRKAILKLLVWASWGLISAIFLGPVREWFIEAARDAGFYEEPLKNASAMLGLFSFAGSWWFQWLSAAVIFTTVGMIIDDRWRRLELGEKIPVTKKGLQDLGANLSALATEMHQFMMQRSAANTARRLRDGADPEGINAWQADRDFERETSAQLMAQFGGRALGALAKLNALGVELPPHMVYSLRSGRPDGAIQMIATMGDLLSSVNLPEAIRLSKDRDFMWQIQN